MIVPLIDCLAERNQGAARELGRRIFEVIDKLAAGELEGPEQVLDTGVTVRSWPAPPIRIYYQRSSEALWIVRLYHQARVPVAR